jgi:hypothetical protein
LLRQCQLANVQQHVQHFPVHEVLLTERLEVHDQLDGRCDCFPVLQERVDALDKALLNCGSLVVSPSAVIGVSAAGAAGRCLQHLRKGRFAESKALS